MADIAHHPSQLDVEGFEILDVLDAHRNEVFRAHPSGNPADTLVFKLLKPEFEPILPGRRRAGSRKLIRAVQRSRGWAPLLETGTSAAGLDYIVQPYYPTGSLLDLLGRGGHWRSSLYLVGEAAAAVGQLGAQGLALGCLRPSYLLVDDDTVVVSFFGMSTRRFDDGTTQYPAPEQQGGSEPTPLCDVYTLGLILAELLADRQREPHEPVGDLITSLPASIPTEVIDLLDHATTSRVMNRIANTALLHRAITRLLADIPDDTADIPVREWPESGVAMTDPSTYAPSSSSLPRSLNGSTPGMAPDPAHDSPNGQPPDLEEIPPASTRTTNGFSTPAIEDGDTTPDIATTATTGLDEVEGQESTPPDSGPLGDLLQPEQARPAIRYHRPTADPRSAAELELETMVETLSGLPATDDDGPP